MRRSSFALALLLAPTLSLADPPRSFLDRSVVSAVLQRALTRAGLGPETTLEQQRRARLAGLLPRFSARLGRTGLFAASAPSVDPLTEPAPSTTSSDPGFTLDARVEFELPRLLFAPEELSLARVELQRYQLRTALEREVIEQLAALERTRAELLTAPAGSPERVRLSIDFDRQRARIETLTGTTIEALLRVR